MEMATKINIVMTGTIVALGLGVMGAVAPVKCGVNHLRQSASIRADIKNVLNNEFGQRIADNKKALKDLLDARKTRREDLIKNPELLKEALEAAANQGEAHEEEAHEEVHEEEAHEEVHEEEAHEEVHEEEAR